MRPLGRKIQLGLPQVGRRGRPVKVQKPTSPLDNDPNTVAPEWEQFLIQQGQFPIGSRRRRVALRNVPDGEAVPFEHLPYQCFQEARKILAADREEKVSKIKQELNKIEKLEARDPKDVQGGQNMKDTRLASLRRHVEQLKIQADVNDPVVKKRFEDGLGDMNKPIYRYYAERRWRAYQQRLISQRIAQFHIVPDILPKLEPTADVQLYFRQKKYGPGEIINSLTTERPPTLRAQVFDKGERLVSVVVVDADVPNPETDSFEKRVHYIASNIELSPTKTSIPLGAITDKEQLGLDWLPAHSQKGAPYHRMAIFLLDQNGKKLDATAINELYKARDGFSLKSFRDKFTLTPFGFTMFRTVWDENMAAVMVRNGLKGHGIEFRPTRVHSMKPVIKPRGWEAKRQGPKYRHLWKYTKRIRGVSNARGWTKRGH